MLRLFAEPVPWPAFPRLRGHFDRLGLPLANEFQRYGLFAVGLNELDQLFLAVERFPAKLSRMS